jgi:hypothetical protein
MQFFTKNIFQRLISIHKTSRHGLDSLKMATLPL